MNTNGLFEGFQVGMQLTQPVAQAKIRGAAAQVENEYQRQRDDRVFEAESRRDELNNKRRLAQIRLEAKLASDRQQDAFTNETRQLTRRALLEGVEREADRKARIEINDADNKNALLRLDYGFRNDTKLPESRFDMLQQGLASRLLQQAELKAQLDDPALSPGERRRVAAQFEAVRTTLNAVGQSFNAALATGKGVDQPDTLGKYVDFFTPIKRDNEPRIITNPLSGEASVLRPDADPSNRSGLSLVAVPTAGQERVATAVSGWGASPLLRSGLTNTPSSSTKTLNYMGNQLVVP